MGMGQGQIRLQIKGKGDTCPPREEDSMLLSISNNVRVSLRDDKDLGPKRDKLMEFLGNAIKSEYDGVPTTSLPTIYQARLDKLLCDMLNPENHPDPVPVQFRADLYIAESVQRQWRSRFRESYFSLDSERYTRLTGPGGQMEDMVFNDATQGSQDLWYPKHIEKLSQYEADASFRSGLWWPNLACVRREGLILCNSSDVFAKAEYDIPSLPLVDGSEVINWPDARVKYTREGTMADMWLPLMTYVGKRVRVLRGHMLKSPFAPKAGVRYDGLYTVLQYGQKRNSQSGVFRLSLTLERHEDQTSMHLLLKFSPGPSHLDDLHLVEKFEGNLVRSRYGEDSYLEWKNAKVQEGMDKELIERTIAVESSATILAWVEKRKKEGKDTKGLEIYRQITDLRWER